MEQAMTFRTDLRQQVEELVRGAVLRAYRSNRLNRALYEVRRSADLNRIDCLKKAVHEIYRCDRYSAAKYAEFDPWILRNIHRAAQLGLHKRCRLRILDIGAGPGYFIAAARALGHDCVGIDVEDSGFSPLELLVYSEILSSLNCRQHVSPISIGRFVEMGIKGDAFDLITAFLICFNRHDKPDQWGVDEWRFFVADAMQHLRNGGTLVLGLNENVKRYGKLSFYDEPLLGYFRSVGTVNGARIVIDKKPTFNN
jgi:SAM-dependent methyltransferase